MGSLHGLTLATDVVFGVYDGEWLETHDPH